MVEYFFICLKVFSVNWVFMFFAHLIHSFKLMFNNKDTAFPLWFARDFSKAGGPLRQVFKVLCYHTTPSFYLIWASVPNTTVCSQGKVPLWFPHISHPSHNPMFALPSRLSAALSSQSNLSEWDSPSGSSWIPPVWDAFPSLFFATVRGLWDLSSPTRHQIWACSSESMEP